MELDTVVPWGRSLSEYEAMFNLTELDLNSSIMGSSDGPSSFNAEWTAKGGTVISVDPIYQFSANTIAEKIEQVCPIVMNQVIQHHSDFVWTTIRTPAQLKAIRLKAMARFIDDYRQRKQAYISAALPDLPFADNTFDLALCSHFLFLYSAHYDEAFHFAAVQELCRIARQVRIYPLVTLDNSPSPYLDSIMSSLTRNGLCCRIEQVSYQFQHGANAMLVIDSE